MNVLASVGQINRPRPSHYPEHVDRDQHTQRMQGVRGTGDKVGDNLRTGPVRMLLLKGELRIRLVSLGRKANVVKLDFVCPSAGRETRQIQIVVLHRRVGRIHPNELAIFQPRLAELTGVDSEVRVALGQVRVAKQGDARDGVHSQRVEVMDKLRQVANGDIAGRRVSVLENNVQLPIKVLDVENHRVPPRFLPALDQVKPGRGARGVSGQVDAARHKILRCRDRPVKDWLYGNAWNQNLSAGLERVAA